MTEKTGKKLKKIRNFLDFDKKTFSDLLEINARTYADYESGRRNMSLPTFRKICDKLDVPMDFLASRSNYIVIDDEKTIIEKISNHLKDYDR